MEKISKTEVVHTNYEVINDEKRYVFSIYVATPNECTKLGGVW